MRTFHLACVASLAACQAFRTHVRIDRGRAPQDNDSVNLAIPELVPEVVGEPDEHFKTWLFQKVMEAKDLPFHHFLNLFPGSRAAKYDPEADGDGQVHPVVLVGGLFSSSLRADIDKTTSKHRYCSKHAKQVPMWLSLSRLLPWEVNCWMENMALSWNTETSQYEDNGVHVETSSWGVVEGFVFVMWDIVYSALQPLGYGKKSVRGAQYDWRLSPAEWKSTGHFGKFKELIEQTYEENEQRKVIPISISQGGQYVRNFLVSGVVDAAWKDKYIESWVSLSGIFDGSPDALASLIFPGHGESENITAFPWVTVKDFRDMSATWAGAYALLPSLSKPLTTPYVVYTPTRNYTLAEMPEALADAGLGQMGTSLYDHRGPAVYADEHLAPPGVDVHCWYANGVKTVEALHYAKGLGAPPTGFEYTDGDGSVHEQGLQACREWPSRDPAHHVDVVVFPGLSHKDLVVHEGPVKRLVQMMSAKNDRLASNE